MAEKFRLYRGLIVVFMLLLAVVAAYLIGRNFNRPTGPGQTIPPVSDSPGEKGGAPVQDEDQPPGLKIHLSDGGAQPEVVETLPLASGEPLSLEEINSILLRLPPLATDPDDRQAFKLPEEVLPPPRTGQTIPEPFPLPPEDTAPEVLAGPLEVLRYSPEGDVPLAPFVNVTFNQPMVPLATLEDLAKEDVPVVMEPTLPGTWRWLGTKTLNFQFDSELIDRMPMATEYTVTVPAGTTSAVGGVLAETVQFKFSTPAPILQSSYPYSSEPQPLEPLFFISFDQRIDPGAVLETIKVEAEGRPVSVRLATDEEIEADEEVSRMVENAVEGRWLVFKARGTLPKDNNIQVEIGPGTPSAEGPLVTENTQSFSFRTYAPLAIVRHGCSWYDENCPPLTPLFIEFNNPIEAESYQESMLRIEPEIPGVTVNIFGNTINIRGATVGRTTYKVTVSGEIKDIFGQTLGRDRQLSFKIGPAEPFLIGPDSSFVTLDPAFKQPVLSLYTMNYNRLDIKVYAVEPSDWDAFKRYLQEYQRTDQPSDPPGRLVRDEVLRIEAPSDKLTEVGIDLSNLLDGEFGHFIVMPNRPGDFSSRNATGNTSTSGCR
jgi:alpha-2-macroglobulin